MQEYVQNSKTYLVFVPISGLERLFDHNKLADVEYTYKAVELTASLVATLEKEDEVVFSSKNTNFFVSPQNQLVFDLFNLVYMYKAASPAFLLRPNGIALQPINFVRSISGNYAVMPALKRWNRYFVLERIMNVLQICEVKSLDQKASSALRQEIINIAEANQEAQNSGKPRYSWKEVSTF